MTNFRLIFVNKFIGRDETQCEQLILKQPRLITYTVTYKSHIYDDLFPSQIL